MTRPVITISELDAIEYTGDVARRAAALIRVKDEQIAQLERQVDIVLESLRVSKEATADAVKARDFAVAEADKVKRTGTVEMTKYCNAYHVLSNEVEAVMDAANDALNKQWGKSALAAKQAIQKVMNRLYNAQSDAKHIIKPPF